MTATASGSYKVSGLHHDTRRDLDTLRETPSAIAAQLLALRGALHALNSDVRLSPQGRRDDIAAARTKFLTWLETRSSRCNQARKLIEQRNAEDFAESPEPIERVARVLEEEQCWRRAQRMLDKGADPLTLIAQAAASGDLLTLTTLRAELPSYYGSPGDTYDSSVVDAYIEAISKAELPLLNPLERAGREIQVEIADGWIGLEAAFAYARAEGEGQGVQTILPD